MLTNFCKPFLALALAVLMALPAEAAVFFVAHPDDLVFLMGGNSSTDVSSRYPTVVVVLTAGDAGNGNLPASSFGIAYHQYNQAGNPYYRVRHNAHEAAIQSWIRSPLGTTPIRTTENFGPSTPAVEKVTIGNAVMYNLNLPDGKMDAFWSGSYSSLADVNGVNVYTPASLRETIRQIINRNNRNTPTLVLNLPEYDPSFSKTGYNDDHIVDTHGDHPDHTATGRFVRDAVNEVPAYRCAYQAVYMGYAINTLPDSLTDGQSLMQYEAAYYLNQVLESQGNVTPSSDTGAEHLGCWDSFHTSFLRKQLWRDGDTGNSACAF